MARPSKRSDESMLEQDEPLIDTSLERDPENRDILTGEPGSHPIGTGIGAALGVGVGTLAGIALSAAGGPVAPIIGAIAGGIYGGGLGHSMSEEIFPTELNWWRDNYRLHSHVQAGKSFDDYEPAYRYGIDASLRNPDQQFESLEPSLRNNWNISRGKSPMEWEDARDAVRDAFDRTGKTIQSRVKDQDLA